MAEFSDGKLTLAASVCEAAAAAAFAVAAMARAASAAGCPAGLVAAAAEQAAQVSALAFAGLGTPTKGASGASECSTGSSCGAPGFAPFGPAARAPPAVDTVWMDYVTAARVDHGLVLGAAARDRGHPLSSVAVRRPPMMISTDSSHPKAVPAPERAPLGTLTARLDTIGGTELERVWACVRRGGHGLSALVPTSPTRSPLPLGGLSPQGRIRFPADPSWGRVGPSVSFLALSFMSMSSLIARLLLKLFLLWPLQVK